MLVYEQINCGCVGLEECYILWGFFGFGYCTTSCCIVDWLCCKSAPYGLWLVRTANTDLKLTARERDVEVSEDLVLQRVCEHGAEKFFTSDELWKQVLELLPQSCDQIEHNSVNVKSETQRTECFDGAASTRTLEQFVCVILGNLKC